MTLQQLNYLVTVAECGNDTEEKWLLDLYGEEYARYKKYVNRCIPWIPKQESEKGL